MSTLPEDEQALALADRLLDEPNADPDDDLRVLSRQLLRLHERVAIKVPTKPMPCWCPYCGEPHSPAVREQK